MKIEFGSQSVFSRLGEDGDMGLPQFPISVAEFVIVVPHISHILKVLLESERAKLKNGYTGYKPFKYSFLFSSIYNKDLELLILALEQKLPEGIHFYSIDGRKLFEVRGPSGGIVTNTVVYLVTEMKI